MELSAAAESWVNLVLLWVGFGAVVGLAANSALPTGSPNSFFGNLTIGMAGCCAGPVAFELLVKPERFHPFSPIGFAIAVLAAIVLALAFRIGLFTVKKIQGRK